MKKKPGRPPLPPGQAKAARFEIRLTEGEKAAYEAAARKAGVDVADWIREHLNEAASRKRAKP
jgi:hypothetical protein